MSQLQVVMATLRVWAISLLTSRVTIIVLLTTISPIAVMMKRIKLVFVLKLKRLISFHSMMIVLREL